MQNTSPLYRRILTDENHWFETSLVIGESGDLITERGEKVLFGGFAIIVSRTGPDSGFSENVIYSVKTSIHMFQNEPVIGKAVSAEIDVKMLNPSGDIPEMAMVIPYVRVCNSTEQSEWLQQGVYYVDTREITHNDNGVDILTLHGFDAMLKAEQYYTDTGSLDWSSGFVSDTAMVQDIADIMGVSVDSRTWDVMTDGYQVPLPTSYTLREVLGYIAGAYAGCFVFTDVGELRLVSILELPTETNLLIDSIGDYITFGGHRIKV